jgi:hypothetical protein
VAVIALISAKGSPGVTTTSLAMALVWPRPVLLVEADPAGGDILAGYIRGQMSMDRGLVQVAIAAHHNRLQTDFNAQLLDLAKPKSPVSRVLLAGLSDPAQAATVAPTWDRLAGHFAWLAGADTGTDVILDCGRLSAGFPPLQLIAAADVVLLVVRATLRSASTAKPAIAAALHGLGPVGKDRLGLLAVDGGEYRPAELAKALHTPVVATMPWRPAEAAALSDGVGRVADSSALMRAARGVEAAIRAKHPGLLRPAGDGTQPSAFTDVPAAPASLAGNPTAPGFDTLAAVNQHPGAHAAGLNSADPNPAHWPMAPASSAAAGAHR